MAIPTLNKAHFPWRAAIYGIVILYIAADIYLFSGPLSRMIDRMQGRGIEEQVAKVPTGLIATVNARPITVADLDRAVWEYCTVRGIEVDQLEPKRLEIIRTITLSRLIDDINLWEAARLNPVDYDPAEVDIAMAQVRGHFPDEEEFVQRLAAQGMTIETYRQHLADQVHQRKWLEAKAAKYITVSDQEIQHRYESDPDISLVPEHWRARHLFLATLDRDPVEVGEKIQAIAASIAAGQLTLEEAIRQNSEDQRTKRTGGDLNYFSADRMPADFIQGIRDLQPNTPFQTKLGWHLAEITEYLPERQATLEEVRAEIRTHIENQKRENVIDQIVRDLRTRSKIWPPDPQPRAIKPENMENKK